jgi:hypothetical protein
VTRNETDSGGSPSAWGKDATPAAELDRIDAKLERRHLPKLVESYLAWLGRHGVEL